ncbi:MAG: hypothetical protein FWD75_04980 [Propionibacteriaceae bacterium]|nr:hypothetical protein [Propionibacteriaceae bacterium]
MSTVGETWQPSDQKCVNGNWFLKGSSGWWPATANKSVYNGNPVVITKTMQSQNTPVPGIWVDHYGTIQEYHDYSSVMSFDY